MQAIGKWATWDGEQFITYDELTLPVRLTPRRVHVTLPSGMVLRFSRFDRAEREQTTWRERYGGRLGTPLKCITITLGT
jgi:hypothetical protein